MKLRGFIQVLAITVAASAALAQQPSGGDASAPPVGSLVEPAPPALALPAVPAALPKMSPDLALQTYTGNARRQLTALGTSVDMTTVEASLPATGQKGRFELRRSFLAPKSLAYGAIKFVGDTFIKTNIIVKLLQSEVDHVEKGEGATTAITPDNYKFSYKGPQEIDGQLAYEFHVKPRQKRPGLFKGKIYLEATTGHILRAQGTLAKSPSVFVKKVEFVQDYEDVAGFSLPAHLHSISDTRIFGKAIIDISHSDYIAHPLGSETNATTPAAVDQKSSQKSKTARPKPCRRQTWFSIVPRLPPSSSPSPAPACGRCRSGSTSNGGSA